MIDSPLPTPNELIRYSSSYNEEEETRCLIIGGLKGLTIYRCMRSIGLTKNRAFNVTSLAFRESTAYTDTYLSIARNLMKAIDRARSQALIRWVSIPSVELDLRDVANKFNRHIERKAVNHVIVDIDGIKIQITKRKLDISGRLSQQEIAKNAVARLSKFLGVEFSELKPMIATVVIRLPFKIALALLSRSLGIEPSYRVKLSNTYWTSFIYRSTVNLYIKLYGKLEYIDLAIAECLPTLCSFAMV